VQIVPPRLSKMEKRLLHALQLVTVQEELRWWRAIDMLKDKNLNPGKRKL
jgi:hypothetical protein